MNQAGEKPPLTIKGGNNPTLINRDTTVAIHWLTATIMPPGRPNAYAAHWLADKLGATVTGAGVPYPRSYTDALALDPGAISWHSDEPRMKLCFNLTGGDCEEWYADGRAVSSTLGDLYLADGNFTRVDVAVDYHRPADIGQLVDAYEENPRWTNVTTLRPYQEVNREGDDVKRRWTGVYIGSRSSGRFLRVYDKATEQGIDGPWVRIELVTRKEYANQLAANIVENGLAVAARGTIMQVARPPLSWWDDALQGDAVECPPLPRRTTDTDRWLIEDVLPVLNRRLMLCDNTRDALFYEYDQVLNSHRRRLHLRDKGNRHRG